MNELRVIGIALIAAAAVFSFIDLITHDTSIASATPLEWVTYIITICFLGLALIVYRR